MITQRGRGVRLDDERSIYLAWISSDCYVIEATKAGAVRRMKLSAEAMDVLLHLYVDSLRYQAKTAPDGIGAEL